jgi:hypothetical protein
MNRPSRLIRRLREPTVFASEPTPEAIWSPFSGASIEEARRLNASTINQISFRSRYLNFPGSISMDAERPRLYRFAYTSSDAVPIEVT